MPVTSVTALQDNASVVVATKGSVLCNSSTGEWTSCPVSMPVFVNNTCNNVLLEVIVLVSALSCAMYHE